MPARIALNGVGWKYVGVTAVSAAMLLVGRWGLGVERRVDSVEAVATQHIADVARKIEVVGDSVEVVRDSVAVLHRDILYIKMDVRRLIRLHQLGGP